MTQSILASTKKVLGIDPSIDVFDQDIIMHINSVFNTLQQLGVGPVEGYQIADETSEWPEFTSNNFLMNSVKSYTYLRVRMLFDPPSTSFHLEAIKEQIKEFEWRMKVQMEGETWPPTILTP